MSQHNGMKLTDMQTPLLVRQLSHHLHKFGSHEPDWDRDATDPEDYPGMPSSLLDSRVTVSPGRRAKPRDTKSRTSQLTS